MANYQNSPQALPLPGPIGKVLLNNLSAADYDKEEIRLDGYQVIVAEMAQ